MKLFTQFIFILFLILSLLSCNDSKNQAAQQINENKFDVNKYAEKFKYRDLKEFKIDTLLWEDRPTYYVSVDSNAFKMIWQDTSVKFSTDFGDNFFYYYSIQNRNKLFQEITILSQTDNCCSSIWYILYDKEGKCISKIEVAGSGVDGDWLYDSFGNFLNDSTYQLYSTECVIGKIDTLTNKEIMECDSTITNYVFKKNGRIVELSKDSIHFEK